MEDDDDDVGPERRQLVDNRIKFHPEVFEGGEDKWPEWSYIFVSYCSGLSEGLGDLMMEAQMKQTAWIYAGFH